MIVEEATDQDRLKQIIEDLKVQGAAVFESGRVAFEQAKHVAKIYENEAEFLAGILTNGNAHYIKSAVEAYGSTLIGIRQ